MCLPSPLQRVENLPLPLFPEDDAQTLEEAQPQLSDVLGSSSRMPISPDVLHYVVRNFVNAAVKKAKKHQIRAKAHNPPPVRVTSRQEKKIVSKTSPILRKRRARKNLNKAVRRRSLLCNELPKNVLKPSSVSESTADKSRLVEEVSERNKPRKRVRRKSPGVNFPRRKSSRLEEKASKDPVGMAPHETPKSIPVDEEISLRSDTMNLSVSGADMTVPLPMECAYPFVHCLIFNRPAVMHGDDLGLLL